MHENEGPLEVCVTLSATIFESNVVIGVIAEPGTALGKTIQLFFWESLGFIAGGNDFEQISQDIIFDGETTNGTECFSLSITNDEVLENVENFTVVLHAAPDTAVVFVNSVLVVTISDDDCKLIPRCNKTVYLLILLDVAVTILAVGDVLEQDQVVEVCIVLTGSTAVNVAVILTAQEGGESPLGSNRVAILLPTVLPLRQCFSHHSSTNGWITTQSIW